MEDQQIVLCDTNIFIEVFKGNSVVIDRINAIQEQNIKISIVTSSELVFGAQDKRELRRWMRSIEDFVVIHVDEAI